MIKLARRIRRQPSVGAVGPKRLAEILGGDPGEVLIKVTGIAEATGYLAVGEPGGVGRKRCEAVKRGRHATAATATEQQTADHLSKPT